MTVAITPDRLDALQADAAMYGPSTCMQVSRGEMLALLAAHKRLVDLVRRCERNHIDCEICSSSHCDCGGGIP